MNGNTCDFLNAVKARHGIESDYQLAKKLGFTPQMVSRYRVGKDQLSDSAAIKVANLLEIDPAIVLASVHAERAKAPEEKAAWTTILERLGGVAAIVLIGIGAISAPSPAQANTVESSGTMCIMSNKRRASRKHQASPFAAALRAFFPIRPIQAA